MPPFFCLAPGKRGKKGRDEGEERTDRRGVRPRCGGHRAAGVLDVRNMGVRPYGKEDGAKVRLAQPVRLGRGMVQLGQRLVVGGVSCDARVRRVGRMEAFAGWPSRGRCLTQDPPPLLQKKNRMPFFFYMY